MNAAVLWKTQSLDAISKLPWTSGTGVWPEDGLRRSRLLFEHIPMLKEPHVEGLPLLAQGPYDRLPILPTRRERGLEAERWFPHPCRLCGRIRMTAVFNRNPRRSTRARCAFPGIRQQRPCGRHPCIAPGVCPQLCGEGSRDDLGRCFAGTQRTPEMAQHGEPDGIPELVEIPSPLPHQAQIVFPQQGGAGEDAFVEGRNAREWLALGPGERG